MTARMTGETALAQLGVGPDLLTGDERRSLDEDGYVVLDNVLTPDQIETLRARLADVVRQRRQRLETGDGLRAYARRRLDVMSKVLERPFPQELQEQYEPFRAKTREGIASLEAALAADDVQMLRDAVDVHGVHDSEFIEDLFAADAVFDLSITTPRVLAAVRHLLGPEFHAKGTYCRAPRVGQGHQPLHLDHQGPREEMCGALWPLDDMTRDNGATRFVPGTHLSGVQPSDALDGDPTRTHPREILIEIKAGQVVAFSGRLWHGGTARTERGGPRRLILSGYSRRHVFREQPLYVGPDTLERLHPAHVWLLHLDDPQLSPGELRYARSGADSSRPASKN